MKIAIVDIHDTHFCITVTKGFVYLMVFDLISLLFDINIMALGYLGWGCLSFHNMLLPIFC